MNQKNKVQSKTKEIIVQEKEKYYLTIDQICPLYLDDCLKIPMRCSQKYILQGFSKAGFRTGFWVHGLNIRLDCGISSRQIPKAIFLTHSHSDHSLAPAKYKGSNEKIEIYLPETTVEPMRSFLEGTKHLSKNGIIYPSDKIYEVHNMKPIGVKAFQEYQPKSLANIKVKIFPCYHKVECYAYGFSYLSKKLKPEITQRIANKEKPQDIFEEIRQKMILDTSTTTLTTTSTPTIQDAKDSVSYFAETPQFIFFGDTNSRALTEHQEWKDYPVVIIESTGFPTITTPKESFERGHLHWEDLLPIMLENSKYIDPKSQKEKQRHWIIIHTSNALGGNELLPYLKEAREKGLVIDFSNCPD